MVDKTSVVLCLREEDSSEYIFFRCSFSMEVFGAILQKFKIDGVTNQWHLLIPWFNCKHICSVKTKIAAVIKQTASELWRWFRNNVIYRERREDEYSIISRVCWGDLAKDRWSEV